jgi:hypothetical protein
MLDQPILIIQVPRGSAIESQLRNQPPAAVSADDVLVQTGPTDDRGYLEAMAGEVVLSYPSPEELTRHSDDVQRVVRLAGTGSAPLVVVIDAAEELQEDQAALVVAAARHAPRTVVLRVIRPSER